MDDTAASPRLMLPAQPALVAGVRRAAWLTTDGEIESPPLAEAARRLTPGSGPPVRPVVCDAKTTAKRLGLSPFAVFDVLELYAFTRPARFVLPTPRGVAQALGLALPGTLEREAESLLASAAALLAELSERAAGPGDAQALPIAWAMTTSGCTSSTTC